MLDTYFLSLTVAQLKVINDALMTSPYHLVFPIINSINSQIERLNGEELQRRAIKAAAPPPVVDPVPVVEETVAPTPVELSV